MLFRVMTLTVVVMKAHVSLLCCRSALLLHTTLTQPTVNYCLGLSMLVHASTAP